MSLDKHTISSCTKFTAKSDVSFMLYVSTSSCSTVTQMSKLNAIHLRDLKEKTRLEQRKNSLEADAQTQQMVCQDELMSIQEEVQRLQGTVLEFKTFVMVRSTVDIIT